MSAYALPLTLRNRRAIDVFSRWCRVQLPSARPLIVAHVGKRHGWFLVVADTWADLDLSIRGKL